jgi:hypothetical protein
MPLTKFEILNILKIEFENLEEIYRVIGTRFSPSFTWETF